MGWPCFMVEPSGEGRMFLRRYDNAPDDAPRARCPGMPGEYSYHNASQVELGVFPYEPGDDGIYPAVDHLAPPHDDPRWPTKCDRCDYVLLEDDHWQVHPRAIFRRPDTGEEWDFRELPIGAMYDTPWMKHARGFVGPDGLSLSVKLPPGGEHDVWHIDGPASSGGRWTRTGTPPNITAQPSILTGSYHGFLQNGELTGSLPDRPLPDG